MNNNLNIKSINLHDIFTPNYITNKHVRIMTNLFHILVLFVIKLSNDKILSTLSISYVVSDLYYHNIYYNSEQIKIVGKIHYSINSIFVIYLFFFVFKKCIKNKSIIPFFILILYFYIEYRNRKKNHNKVDTFEPFIHIYIWLSLIFIIIKYKNN